MKLTLILLIAGWCFGGVSLEPTPDIAEQSRVLTSEQTDKQSWRPASYKGLTAGKSSRADLLLILGPPQRLYSPDNDPDSDYITFVYDGGGEFPGQFSVDIDKRNGLIAFMDLQLQDISRETVIERFGPDYVLTKYDFCPGFDDAEAAPIYESEGGGATYIEYRSRGIMILVDDAGAVYHVGYLGEPPGYRSQRECPAGESQLRLTSKRRKDLGFSNNQWLGYEPAVVELAGTLTVERKYGPPNFGENPKTDAKVSVPVLVLAQAVDVHRNLGDPPENVDVKRIRRIQLLVPNLKGSYKEFVGKMVVVTGSLFRAQTGGHYTRVVMDVQALSPLPQRR